MEKGYEKFIYTIQIKKDFTSQVFYYYYLRKIQDYINVWKRHKSTMLFIDLSNCKSIDGNVIPNFFISGMIIKNITHISPQIYIPGSNGSGVMSYLKSINFLDINKDIKIFDIQANESIRKNSYNFPDFCTTVLLNEDLSEEQVVFELQKKYSELFQKYLDDFSYYIFDAITNRRYVINLLEFFCKQVCYNSLDHGKSPCFITMQTNRELKKIFIAISDCGKGMTCGIQESISRGYKPIIVPKEKELRQKLRSSRLDLLSIIEGVIFRFGDPIYGLWNVLREVMNMGGVIYFHSGEIRMALSNIDPQIFVESETKLKMANMLYNFLKKSENIQYTTYYAGTHVEIEVPLKL